MEPGHPSWHESETDRTASFADRDPVDQLTAPATNDPVRLDPLGHEAAGSGTAELLAPGADSGQPPPPAAAAAASAAAVTPAAVTPATAPRSRRGWMSDSPLDGGSGWPTSAYAMVPRPANYPASDGADVTAGPAVANGAGQPVVAAPVDELASGELGLPDDPSAAAPMASRQRFPTRRPDAADAVPGAAGVPGRRQADQSKPGQPQPGQPQPGQPQPGQPQADPHQPDQQQPGRSRGSRLALTAGLLAVLIVIVAGIAALAWRSTRSDTGNPAAGNRAAGNRAAGNRASDDAVTTGVAPEPPGGGSTGASGAGSANGATPAASGAEQVPPAGASGGPSPAGPGVPETGPTVLRSGTVTLDVVAGRTEEAVDLDGGASASLAGFGAGQLPDLSAALLGLDAINGARVAAWTQPTQPTAEGCAAIPDPQWTTGVPIAALAPGSVSCVRTSDARMAAFVVRPGAAATGGQLYTTSFTYAVWKKTGDA